MKRCIECGKDTAHLVCADCERKLMTAAEERGLPVVGGTAAARLIGFDPRRKESER